MRARHERSEPRDERREGKASEAKVERQWSNYKVLDKGPLYWDLS